MAKSSGSSKETSMPVVVSLVFFVLTTIGLGVFVYVLYSDQEAKDAEVKKAQDELKNARAGEKESQMVARLHRVFLGVPEADDLSVLQSEVKEGDKTFQELKKLNDAVRDKAPKLAKATADRLNAALKGAGGADLSAVSVNDLDVWPAAIDGGQLRAPGSSLLDVMVRSRTGRDLAATQTTADRGSYENARKGMQAASDAAATARATFDKEAKKIPVEFGKEIAKLKAIVDANEQKYLSDQAELRGKIDQLTTEKEKLEGKIRAQAATIESLEKARNELASKTKQATPLEFDQPQGKVTRRTENVIEIDLGSNARVRPGLTFTVLPNDYPEKGRQSRMRQIRTADDRGVYKSTEQFVPKATVEVIEVLGGDLSRARITSEYDDIRDRVLVGDLLYNAVWRKGQTDHVALVGVFDTNGDGTDDIAAVVRDLGNMGIPVDAYMDLRDLKWAGRLTNETRFLVVGYNPQPTASDPNLEAKKRITETIDNAKKEAEAKGVTVVSFRDFFGKMGYRVKTDVSEDRINQASSRYLSGVGSDPNPAPPPQN